MNHLVKKYITLVIVLLFYSNAAGQKEYLQRIEYFVISDLAISPFEEIWLSARNEVYAAQNMEANWSGGALSLPNRVNANMVSINRIDFLSKDVIIVSGTFPTKSGRDNYMYRSNDRGKTWTVLKFGDSDIRATHVNLKGEAWFSTQSGAIYNSKDYGQSWKKQNLTRWEDGSVASVIFFTDDSKMGLFGTVKGNIYRTEDNCTTWKSIPTPLDQKKYTRLYDTDSDEIGKIRLSGNRYIVRQGRQIFYSSCDTIDWKQLTKVQDFEADDTGIYLIYKDGNVEKVNERFRTIWKSPEKIIGIPEEIALRNEKVFALTYSKLYSISNGIFVSNDMLSDKVMTQDPIITFIRDKQQYGFERNIIYKYDSDKKAWKKHFETPYNTLYPVVVSNQIILIDRSLKSYHLYDEKANTIKEYKLPDTMFSQSAKRVSELIFEDYGYVLNSYPREKIFENKDGQFVLSKMRSTASFLEAMPEVLTTQTVGELLSKIDKGKNNSPAISDFKFISADIKDYKDIIAGKKMTREKNHNNRYEDLFTFPRKDADFEFYSAVADSLDSISSETLEKAFNNRPLIGASHKSKTIRFRFTDGTELMLESTEYIPQHLYLPWTASYKPLEFTVTSPQFITLIDEITKQQFFDRDRMDKAAVIFDIANYLYTKKLRGE